MDSTQLRKLTRTQLQALAKRELLKAVGKTEDIIRRLVDKHPAGVPVISEPDTQKEMQKGLAKAKTTKQQPKRSQKRSVQAKGKSREHEMEVPVAVSKEDSQQDDEAEIAEVLLELSKKPRDVEATPPVAGPSIEIPGDSRGTPQGALQPQLQIGTPEEEAADEAEVSAEVLGLNDEAGHAEDLKLEPLVECSSTEPLAVIHGVPTQGVVAADNPMDIEQDFEADDDAASDTDSYQSPPRVEHGPTIREVKHILREFTTLVNDKPAIRRRMRDTSMLVACASKLGKEITGDLEELVWTRVVLEQDFMARLKSKPEFYDGTAQLAKHERKKRIVELKKERKHLKNERWEKMAKEYMDLGMDPPEMDSDDESSVWSSSSENDGERARKRTLDEGDEPQEENPRKRIRS